jgi:hypothetical protein
MMNNASCNEGRPDDSRGQIDAALHNFRLCVCKFQALLLISASEPSELGGTPTAPYNAAVMRVLLIEMYGTPLTAFR